MLSIPPPPPSTIKTIECLLELSLLESVHDKYVTELTVCLYFCHKLFVCIHSSTLRLSLYTHANVSTVWENFTVMLHVLRVVALHTQVLFPSTAQK
jgi:hypothetical protein